MHNKVFVVCPGGVTTGGPELLHQLVSELRNSGHDAFICYFPFDRKFEIPAQYQTYNVAQAKLEDESNNLIVLPESGTKISRKLQYAEIAIWWLSVDNYYALPKSFAFVPSVIARALGAVLVRRPLRSIRRYRHFAQSQYAIDYLGAKGIHAEFLGDYLSRNHTPFPKELKQNSVNIIAYNPKKGVCTTRKLIAQCPQWRFVPIAGMSASEVKELLSSAMLYIDFGHHPGRDRLPREAALAGCCVITGRRGAAANDVDVAIPEEFKIDQTSADFVPTFQRAAERILTNFGVESEKFGNYRNSILAERMKFSEDVLKLFAHDRSVL